MSIIAQVVLMDSSIQTEIYPPLKMNLADYKDTIVFYQSDFKDSEIEDVFKVKNTYSNLNFFGIKHIKVLFRRLCQVLKSSKLLM